MPQIITLGELLVDFLSVRRDTLIKDSSGFTKAAGGAPANVAAGAARLGVTAGFIGKVGADPFGQFLKETLEDCGVDTACLAVDPSVRTTLAFSGNRSDGSKDFVFYRNPGADMMLRPEEIKESYFEDCRIFHFGSVSFGCSPSREASLAAIAEAKRHGCLISYDPNLRPGLWDSEKRAREEIRRGFSLADFVKISDEEAEFITGICPETAEGEERILRLLLESGAKAVCLTRGSRGCAYGVGLKRGSLPGYPVDCADSTGAGDAFAACVLACLVKGGWDRESLGEEARFAEFERVMRRANAAGAIAVTGRGAIPSMANEAAIDRFLAKYR